MKYLAAFTDTQVELTDKTDETSPTERAHSPTRHHAIPTKPTKPGKQPGGMVLSVLSVGGLCVPGNASVFFLARRASRTRRAAHRRLHAMRGLRPSAAEGARRHDRRAGAAPLRARDRNVGALRRHAAVLRVRPEEIVLTIANAAGAEHQRVPASDFVLVGRCFSIKAGALAVDALYRWLGDRFGVVVAADRDEPLVVMRLGDFLRELRFRGQDSR